MIISSIAQKQFVLACSLILSFQLSAQVTFQTPPVISMPAGPQELAKGDFNNDGLIDFVSANFNGFANQQVTILINSGSGTFAGSNKRDFASAPNAIDVAVGDFNEDGNLDVVTCSQATNNNFSLLLGDGTGNLAAPITLTAGDNPQGITVGDMNKDGNLDVLITNRGTPADVYIYLGDGTGNFAAPTIIAIANVWDIAVSDFNGDSNPDFAVLISGTPTGSVSIRFGDGGGTNYATGPTITGFQTAEDLIAVNLDDDTDVDILAGAGYSINDGSGNFAARVVLTQTNYEYTVADLNKDSHPDIIANDNNQNTPNVRIFLGDGAGSFSLLAKFEANGLLRGLEVADINGDSNLDIVGVGGWGPFDYVDVLLGDGTGYFPNSIIKYPMLTDPRDLVKGDFNEDGIADIAICNTVGNLVTIYLGQGNGKFSKTSTNYSTGNFPIQIMTIDYNKDSNLDLVTYNQTGSSVTVLTGAGDGSFSVLANIPVTSTISGRMTTADFNNDTNPDLIVSGYTSNLFNFLAGTGSGFSPSVTTATSGNILEVKAADFNGDGNQDFVADLNSLSQLVVFFGDGTGSFTAGTPYTSAGSFFLIADINNDAKPDVIAYDNSVLGSDFFINDGTGAFVGSSIVTSLGGFPWGYEDMDGDGSKDLVLGSQNPGSSQPGQILIYKGSATGLTNTVLINKQFSGGIRLVIEDVNVDGKPDIIAISNNLYEDYLGTLINTSGPVACSPPIVTFVSSSVTQCEGTPVTFTVTATGTAPLTYEWRKLATPIVGETTNTFTIPSISLSNAGQYAVSVSNACGSSLSPAFSLFVNNAPNAPTATNASSCNPSSVILTASGAANTLYRWYTTPMGGAPISGQVNSTYTTPVLTSTTTYYVTINNITCESARVPVTVTIGGVACTNQPPILAATTSNIAAGGTAVIDLIPLVNDPDNNIDINSFSIVTAPMSGAIAQIVNGVLTIDYASTSFSGADQLTIQICDLLGSCVQQQLIINVIDLSTEELIVYNGISPNGDLFNEKWIIQNIEVLPDTRENKVSIYNRWGDLVFEVTNYDNDTRVFNGVNKDGNDLPSGTYFFRIEFRSRKEVKTGYLSIKK